MTQKSEDFGRVSPKSLQRTLKYLYEEAMQAGLQLPAHFIGVAAEVCVDQKDSNNRSA